MENEYWWGTGRRKTSVARVRIRPGTGEIKINERDLKDYFPRLAHRKQVTKPLEVTGTEDRYDVYARTNGGGVTGQAGAMKLGISRALVKADSSFEQALKDEELLTRDPRMVERKKYGRHKARRGKQSSKR
ncbi:MAG: 30S ribosomal protein S9 [Candidatus Brocadiia bacterium]